MHREEDFQFFSLYIYHFIKYMNYSYQPCLPPPLECPPPDEPELEENPPPDDPLLDDVV